MLTQDTAGGSSTYALPHLCILESKKTGCFYPYPYFSIGDSQGSAGSGLGRGWGSFSTPSYHTLKECCSLAAGAQNQMLNSQMLYSEIQVDTTNYNFLHAPKSSACGVQLPNDRSHMELPRVLQISSEPLILCTIVALNTEQFDQSSYLTILMFALMSRCDPLVKAIQG